MAKLDGKHVVVCVGSGGVGKTTISAALALGLAMRGRRVAVVTIDPANRLAAALGLDELAGEPHRIDPEALGALSGAGVTGKPVTGKPVTGEPAKEEPMKGELWAMMLDAKRTLDQMIARLAPDEERLRAILENPVYRELSNAVAGSHELGAIAKVYELHEEHEFDTIVLDTPPSRNALEFLDAPARLLAFMEGRALQVFLAPSGLTARLFGRGTGIVFAIFARVTGIDMLGELSRFFTALSSVIDGFGERTRAVAELLRAPGTEFVIVTSPEPEPAREAVHLADRLREAGMTRAGVVVNRVQSQGLHGQTHEQVAKLLADELGEALAGRVAANLADVDVLAQRDAATMRRLSEELEEPDPIVVGQLDDDVCDLAGLAEVSVQLLG
jgi:anion-transporting  ArsA/GET3 family ATPase